MLATREELVGFFAGAAVTVPWLGRITYFSSEFVLPSSAIALLFIPAACVTVFSLGRDNLSIRIPTVIMLFMMSLYVILVLQSISWTQIEFFLSASRWMESEKYYFSAKLLKFSLSLVPALIAGLCVALVRDRESVLRGLFVAIVVVALVASLNVARHGDVLFATNYEVASAYFLTTYEANLPSVVSYGFLFCVAVVASMALRKLWLLSGIFIFMLFLLGRRTEFTLGIISILVFYLWNFRYGRDDYFRYTFKISVVLLTAVILSAVLSNEISVLRWAGLWDSVKERVDILQVATERVPVGAGPSHGAGADGGSASGGHQGDSNSGSGGATAGSEPGTIAELLFGYGLGWYSELGAANDYPHNAMVEAWFESGAIAALVLGCIYIYSLILSYRAIRQQSGLAICLMIACLIVTSMKSGDIVSGVRLFSFMIFSTSFGPALRHTSRNISRYRGAADEHVQPTV